MPTNAPRREPKDGGVAGRDLGEIGSMYRRQASKSVDSINARLQLVMKSGKYSLGQQAQNEGSVFHSPCKSDS